MYQLQMSDELFGRFLSKVREDFNETDIFVRRCVRNLFPIDESEQFLLRQMEKALTQYLLLQVHAPMNLSQSLLNYKMILFQQVLQLIGCDPVL